MSEPKHIRLRGVPESDGNFIDLEFDPETPSVVYIQRVAVGTTEIIAAIMEVQIP